MSAAGTATAREPEPTRKPDANLALMKPMGANWYNPTPEWQHSAFQDKEFRLTPGATHELSFVRKFTIGARKIGLRTNFMYDWSRPEGERALGFKELAELTGESVPNTIRYWNELAAHSLVWQDEQGRLCLWGNETKATWRKQGEDSAKSMNINDDEQWEKLCTDNFPDYQAKQLKQLPKAERPAFVADQDSLDAFERQAIAEATDAIRSEVKQRRDKHLSERYRIKVRRFERKEKKAAAKVTEKPLVQLSLLWTPELSVQNFDENSVRDEEKSSYETESEFVQNRSNKESDNQSENGQTHSPPTPSLAHAKAGRSEPQTPPIKAEDHSPKFEALLFAADEAHMTYAGGQVPKLKASYQALDPKERIAAIDGIRIRRETGEYDDAHFVPTLRRYLTEQLWTAKLRPGVRKKRVDTAYLDSE